MLGTKVSNFIKKESLSQVFSCEFCEISKNTFLIVHLLTTVSEFGVKYNTLDCKHIS